MKSLTFQEAVVEAIKEEMLADDNIIHLGQNIGPELGGPMWSCKGLEEFAAQGRLIDTPISESAMVGAGVGAALRGLRPLVQIMYAEFMSLVMAPLICDGASVWWKSGGVNSVPLVVRTLYGIQFQGGGHYEDYSSWLINAPGLRVVMPATPYDAKGLMKSAIRDNNPVVFMEHVHLYHGQRQEIPDGEYTIPLGQADVKRQGKDVTIVAAALMLSRALEAAEALAKEGIEAEVIDPRCLAPLDTETIVASVTKTGRLVVVTEAWKTGGFAAEVTAVAAEQAGSALKSPPYRLAPPEIPVPFAVPLLTEYLPDANQITAAVKKVMA